MRTPCDITGNEFDIHARCLLGYQFVQIFGTGAVTATIKQISVYTGFYIHKARQDGFLIGQPLSLRNFSDGLMETAHKTTKVGTISYSRGKQGPSTESSNTANQGEEQEEDNNSDEIDELVMINLDIKTLFRNYVL